MSFFSPARGERQARDEEAPGKLSLVLVHVAVMDVNDNEPVFLNQPYYALVSTSAPRGHVVTKVSLPQGEGGREREGGIVTQG